MPPFRKVATKLVTTDTTSTSLVVGGATPVATTGTGGIVAGPIAGTLITGTSVAVTAGLATSGGTLSTHGLVMPTGVPAVTTNALYNNGASALYWNGLPVVTGGGTVPAGANGDVQFNNAGAFGADTGDFTYGIVAANTLGVNNVASQAGSVLAITSTTTTPTTSFAEAGPNLTVTAAAGLPGLSGTGDGAGGELFLAGGAGVCNAGGCIIGGNGGRVFVTGGAGSGGGLGGRVNITGGAAVDGLAGLVQIAGGTASGGASAQAGNVIIKSGDIVNWTGVVVITTGTIPAGNTFVGWSTPDAISISPATPAGMASDIAGTGTLGGRVSVLGGPGGSGGSGAGANGGAGGALRAVAGTGGSTSASAAFAYVAGAGGAATFSSGPGGSTSGSPTTSTGGAGGLLSVVAGNGGDASGGSGTRTGGDGGSVVIGSGAGGSGASATGAVGIITFNIAATEAARFNTSANLGVGTGATVSARIHGLSTTEQLRLGFDASNYLSTTVASNGGTTFAVTGGGAVTFSQAVTGSAGFIGNLTGNVTGNTSGSAATVTAASQPAITSLGTLTTLTVAGPTLLTGTISPTQLVGNTNDWAPTGLSTANVIRVDVSMNINLTGLVAQSDGRVIALYNKSAFVVSLIHDATSTAANRFYCPGGIDYPLSAFGTTLVRYDGTDQRWTVFI